MLEICEVGPRDGLQNEKVILSVEDRVEMIKKLAESGITSIEAVSFVNPKVVPQMAQAEAIMERVPRSAQLHYAGLVLSASGMNRALQCKLDEINVVLAASSTFNQKNARRTTEQSLSEFAPLVYQAKQDNHLVTGTIGTAFGCPYEGEISISNILLIAKTLLDYGVDGITLADTTGMANPKQVNLVVRQFTDTFPDTKLGLHFHNTRGLGIANVYAGYQAGVTRFDSSVGGLGGCPFAPLSVGNVCTEDLVHMFRQTGVETGIDLNMLLDTARWIEEKVCHQLDGYVVKAGPAYHNQ